MRGRRRGAAALPCALLVLLAPLARPAHAQALPDGSERVTWRCPAGRADDDASPLGEAERAERELRARYREVFPSYLAAVPAEPDPVLLMPVEGVRVANVADTWGGLRDGGRLHEGQDIFAPLGTPVRAAAPGFVYRVGTSPVGGNVVTVIGGGGRRYYYAHLSGFADVREGQRVGLDTVLGYVGNTGNAASTPPHLHFGVYVGDENPCAWNAVDPLPLLADR